MTKKSYIRSSQYIDKTFYTAWKTNKITDHFINHLIFSSFKCFFFSKPWPSTIQTATISNKKPKRIKNKKPFVKLRRKVFWEGNRSFGVNGSCNLLQEASTSYQFLPIQCSEHLLSINILATKHTFPQPCI